MDYQRASFAASASHQLAMNFQLPMAPPSSTNFESYSTSETISSLQRQGSKKTTRTNNNNNKRKKGDDNASVSEDGTSRNGGGRKEERNAREQRRSQQIVDQITNLRDLLVHSSVPTKPDKYSTLVTAADYIRQLQERSAVLESEQKRLLLTIGQAGDMVNNNKYMTSEAGGGMLEATVGGSSKMERKSVSMTSSDEDEDSHVYVNGLDYRDVFLACPVAGAITSIDGRFLDCNPDFEELTGYSKDELFRKPQESSPFEPSERHMSLFNVLKRADMERLFVVMSDMLRKPALDNQEASTTKETDRWSDRVVLNRKEDANVSLFVARFMTTFMFRSFAHYIHSAFSRRSC
jgi:PAS domain-containing protein